MDDNKIAERLIRVETGLVILIEELQESSSKIECHEIIEQLREILDYKY